MRSDRRRLLGAAFAAAVGAAAAPREAGAQSGDAGRPLTVIVPFAPGGIADLTARTVAQRLQGILGRTVIVDNRPSAGSIVGTQAVATAAPDGNTLLLMSNGNAVSVSLFRKLPFDVQRDFVPISTLGFFDLVFAVAPQARWRGAAEFIADARARPGKLTLGTIAVGSTQHLAAELFKARTGIDVVVVPYKGSPAVITALRSGEIDAAFEIVGPTLGQIAGGAVRALAVTSTQRNPALPQVPTLAESGVRDYDVASWNALAAPRGTPPAVVERLNQAVREAVADAGVQQRLRELGVRAQAGTPQQLQTLLTEEIVRWREAVHAARIEPE